MDVRTKRLTKHIDLKGIGLELGPLTSPVLSKDKTNVKYVDHMSLEELREKYKTEPVDLNKIVKPDYVLSNKTLSQIVKGQKFDYIIASHVIEHVPDTVRWFQDLASVLKVGGVLSLAIPDKRFTFDITRIESTPAQVMGAYYDRLSRSSSQMMYDFAREFSVNIDSGIAWREPDAYVTTKKRWSLDEVQAMCVDNLDPQKYVDCHCYVYTPTSFITILSELITQELFSYEVVDMIETRPGELEFYVSLRKLDPKSITIKKQLRSLPRVKLAIHKEAELQHNIDMLQQEIHMLTHSLSWKVTKPLRKLRSLL